MNKNNNRFMNMKHETGQPKTRKYIITISLYADSEKEAYDLARRKLYYGLLGDDNLNISLDKDKQLNLF